MIWENYWVGPNPNQVPLVKAPDGPYKLRPSTPGGMPIPNRDKTVYDTFGKKTLQTGTETLLPEPEQPLPAPEPLISNQKKDKLAMNIETKLIYASANVPVVGGSFILPNLSFHFLVGISFGK